MKKQLIILILLFLAFIRCTGQEPDTLIYFTQDDLDSAVKWQQDYYVPLINERDDSIVNLNAYIDSILDYWSDFYTSGDLIVIRDTFFITIIDSANTNLRQVVRKRGRNLSGYITDGDLWIHSNYFDGHPKYTVMDTTKTLFDVSIGDSLYWGQFSFER